MKPAAPSSLSVLTVQFLASPVPSGSTVTPIGVASLMDAFMYAYESWASSGGFGTNTLQFNYLNDSVNMLKTPGVGALVP